MQIEPRPLLEVRAFAVTDAGSCALWDPEAFEDIVDEGAWEDDPFDDAALRRYIRAGHYVPVGVGADGTYEVLVRVGTTAALPGFVLLIDPATAGDYRTEFQTFD